MKVEIISPFGFNQEIVVSGGNTVRSCLKHLETQHAGLECLNEEGRLFPYLAIAINKEVINEDELDRTIENGDELSIIFMELGG